MSLRKSQAQLQAFIRHAPVSIAMLDLGMNYVATSDRWLKEYGLGRADLVGINHYDLHPDMPAVWRNVHRQALAGATLSNDEELWLHADGTKQWQRWAVLPWRDEDGAIGGIIISTEDITARKQAEDARRESEQRYAAVFERAPFGMSLVHLPGGEVVAANDAFLRLFEYSREDVLGRTSLELKLVDAEARAEARKEFAARGSVRDFECICVSRSGKQLTLLLNLDGVEIGDEKYMLSILRDITELKQAEQERKKTEELHRQVERARELDELKTRFFAGVSHELRTPLALILGPASRLQEGPLGEGEQRHLDTILRNARILRGHVDDLLDISKLEAGRTHVDWAETDVARLVRFVASHFDSVADERGIVWTHQVPELRAEVDPKLLLRVLSNLLSNAFKFTPQGGQVRLTLRDGGTHYAIEVADSGPGIPPEHRDVVFDRFHQLEGGTTRQFGGTGLGLAIVRELVGLHGGTVSISDAPEQGALFSVVLPARAPEGVVVRPESDTGTPELAAQPRSAPAEGPAARSNVAGTLVLIVEDNADMSRFLCDVLAADHQVETAFDGREGLAKAMEHRPDLILTDVMMPGMSGEELVAALRRDAELARTPIIVLSAKTGDEQRLRLLRLGAQDYLIKPFSAEELRARVSNLIAWRRAEWRFDAIMENAPDGLVILDREGIMLMINRELERLFGYTRDELIGKPAELLLPQLSRARSVFQASSAEGHPRTLPMGLGLDLHGRRKDGHEFPVDLSLGVLKQGHELLVTAAIRDVTEQQQLIAELRRALAEVKQLSGLLPMCSWCKKVRDDQGYWGSVEEYIASRTDATFTHGICSSCATELRGKHGR